LNTMATGDKSKKILICNNLENRNSIIEEVLTMILPSLNLKKFKEFSSLWHKKNLYLEIFQILNRFTRSDNSEDEWKNKIHEAFLETVTHLRLFHACKPVSLDSYLHNGIVKANQSLLEELARQIWLTETSPNQHRTNVENAIRESAIFFTPYEKRVFLIVDDNVLLKNASHYLIRGSEYLQAISAKIERDFVGEYKDPLRTRGVPTIIECDVPVANLKRNFNDLWDILIFRYLSSHIYSNYIDDEIDYTITMDHVPPNLIIGHTHPRALRDPHNEMKLIKYNNLTCSHC
jgi:hypothetical protein